MNRIIKFRAWDIDAEKMIKPEDCDGEYVWQFNGHGLIEVLSEQVVDSFPGGLYHKQDNKWLPTDVVLMQFTGLQDKEGNEIYEGDILFVQEEDEVFGDYGVNYLVEWGGDYPAFTLSGYEDLEYNSLQHVCHVAKCEVIGNIYQNHELLTK